ncbi:MAG: hypothetical protein KDD73_05910 [Anaerolineales bacterium]|nr:hypothetical protein [Anaerolineales bacterium]MCB9127144.1 hypothetical protein [Ardenticatenales bacterium]MCB9171904.1 hypothetical protein [Ardenticatenales bacterium]
MDSRRDPAFFSQFGLLQPLLFLLLAFVILVSSWMSDDAYIMLRVVDNFVNGYGLTWNVVERVQVYSHPLWLLALTPIYALTREAFVTTILFSTLLALLAAWLLARHVASSRLMALFLLLILLLSRGFVDFSTGGLENSLSHLLMAAFFALYFNGRGTRRTLLALSTIASLAIVARLDIWPIYLPPLLLLLGRYRSTQTALTLLAGQWPLIGWLLFSLLYYGFLLPNPAYAKLNTGIESEYIARQGLHYLANALVYDPFLLLVIVAGVLLPFVAPLTPARTIVGSVKSEGGKRGLAVLSTMAVSVGILLSVLYVIRIGGDFMSGRFLIAPFFAALCVVARYPARPQQAAAFGISAALLVALSLQMPLSTLRMPSTTPPENPIDANGLVNERLVYFYNSSFLMANRNTPLPFHPWRIQGERMANSDEPVQVEGATGFHGYFAGPTVYLADVFALSDPLTARLPMTWYARWRIGHFGREFPEGYIESLASDENKLTDPALARLYDKIRLITRGRLFDPARLAAIWDLNVGGSQRYFDWEAYRFPDKVTVEAASVSEAVPAGIAWDDPRTTPFPDDGIEIVLPRLSRANMLELSLDINDLYRLVYWNGDRMVASEPLSMRDVAESMGTKRVAVPHAAQRTGFDRVHIFVAFGDDAYALGHFRLLE